MRLIFLLVLLAAVGVLLGREILSAGAARRAGADPRAINRRLRRRAKGLALLLAVYAGAAWFEDAAAWGAFSLREGILHVGGVIILVFWLLILVARDIRETAMEAAGERQAFAVESLQRIEEEIRRIRAAEKDAATDEAKQGDA